MIHDNVINFSYQKILSSDSFLFNWEFIGGIPSHFPQKIKMILEIDEKTKHLYGSPSRRQRRGCSSSLVALLTPLNNS